MRPARKLALCLLALGFIYSAWAQARRNDPLTPAEVDELRDAAQEPAARLKLFVKFARARVDLIQQKRGDPKTTDRAQQTHDLLQDFLDVYNELSDNLDTFVQRRADLRKPLKDVIEADIEFQSKLQALQSSAEAAKTELAQYQFVLNSAMDAVNNGAQDHRQLLAEQEADARRKKK